MSSSDRVSIPLIAELIPEGTKSGTQFMVEFDPDSQWLAVATTIAAKYLQAGGRVGVSALARPPEALKESLALLGVDVSAAIRGGRLVIDDWHTATLTGGRIDSGSGKASLWEPIESGHRIRSLKLGDLSVEWLKASKQGWVGDAVEEWPAGALTISEAASELLRFNDETTFVEFTVTRAIPDERKRGRVSMLGLVRGVQSEAFYRRLELAGDGIIDIRVLEQEGLPKNLLRIRTLKGQRHDNRWHEIEIKPNGEADLKR